MEVSGTAIDGSLSRVTLSRTDGLVTLCSAPISSLERGSGFRTTSVILPGGRTIEMVEHLFAALSGARIFRGVAIDVEGSALPLLDGGARAWSDALRALDIAPQPLSLRVIEAAAINGATFEPFAETSIDVVLEGLPSHIETTAHWGGDTRDFEERIAPARTFALESDLEGMLGAGYRANLDPKTVLVITRAGILGTDPTASEPARHKLLDLLGDLYLYGGPFIGRGTFLRPGHDRNHTIIREALERGILAQ